jgi:hypothetical protein
MNRSEFLVPLVKATTDLPPDAAVQFPAERYQQAHVESNPSCGFKHKYGRNQGVKMLGIPVVLLD